MQYIFYVLAVILVILVIFFAFVALRDPLYAGAQFLVVLPLIVGGLIAAAVFAFLGRVLVYLAAIQEAAEDVADILEDQQAKGTQAIEASQ